MVRSGRSSSRTRRRRRRTGYTRGAGGGAVRAGLEIAGVRGRQRRESLNNAAIATAAVVGLLSGMVSGALISGALGPGAGLVGGVAVGVLVFSEVIDDLERSGHYRPMTRKSTG